MAKQKSRHTTNPACPIQPGTGVIGIHLPFSLKLFNPKLWPVLSLPLFRTLIVRPGRNSSCIDSRLKASTNAQAELAARLGWKQTTISDIEIGDTGVTAIELIELAKALQFDPAAALRRIAKIEE
jgi:hypothetical protein